MSKSTAAKDLNEILQRLAGRFPDFAHILEVTIHAVKGSSQPEVSDPAELIRLAIADGCNSYADIRERTALAPSVIHYHCYKLAEAGVIVIKNEGAFDKSQGRPKRLFFFKS